MPRTQRGTIDELAGYTLYDAAPGATPADDYFLYGSYTVWGSGLITFGSPTDPQIAFMSDITHHSLSSFPGDYISFGFPITSPGPIEVWGGGLMIRSTPPERSSATRVPFSGIGRIVTRLIFAFSPQ